MRIARWGGLITMAAIASCGGGDSTGPNPNPVGPVAGVFKVVLTTPNADDGALLFTISGGTISSVDAGTGYQVYSARVDSLTTRVLVTGDIAAGEVVRLHVPDTARLSVYRASVTQAASRSSFEAQAIGAYRLALAH